MSHRSVKEFDRAWETSKTASHSLVSSVEPVPGAGDTRLHVLRDRRMVGLVELLIQAVAASIMSLEQLSHRSPPVRPCQPLPDFRVLQPKRVMRVDQPFRTSTDFVPFSSKEYAASRQNLTRRGRQQLTRDIRSIGKNRVFKWRWANRPCRLVRHIERSWDIDPGSRNSGILGRASPDGDWLNVGDLFDSG